MVAVATAHTVFVITTAVIGAKHVLTAARERIHVDLGHKIFHRNALEIGGLDTEHRDVHIEGGLFRFSVIEQEAQEFITRRKGFRNGDHRLRLIQIVKIQRRLHGEGQQGVSRPGIGVHDDLHQGIDAREQTVPYGAQLHLRIIGMQLDIQIHFHRDLLQGIDGLIGGEIHLAVVILTNVFHVQSLLFRQDRQAAVSHAEHRVLIGIGGTGFGFLHANIRAQSKVCKEGGNLTGI